MNKLTDWINTQLNEKGWSYSELARRSNLSKGTISNVMTGQQTAGWDFCHKIAKALKIPSETVFRLAGLLPSLPTDHIQEEQVIYAFRQLPTPELKKAALAALRGMAGQHSDIQSPE